MSIRKSALAVILAATAALAISVTAFAAAAGPLTIRLTCDSGPNGSGTFTVTANARFTTVTVRCGGFATVTNPAWTAGSIATIHQDSATGFGQLRAADFRITLSTAAETVTIRNFRAAVSAATVAPTLRATSSALARTGAGGGYGGGVPAVPIGLAVVGVLLLGAGGRLLIRKN